MSELQDLKGYTGLSKLFAQLTSKEETLTTEPLAVHTKVIASETDLHGLPERKGEPNKIFRWGALDAEYYVNPEQEEESIEKLQYQSALFLFHDADHYPQFKETPLAISALYFDENDTLLKGVCFLPEGAIIRSVSPQVLNDQHSQLTILFAILQEQFPLQEEPSSVKEIHSRHPIKKRHTKKEKEIKAPRIHFIESAKEPGTGGFWITVVIALIVFAILIFTGND